METRLGNWAGWIGPNKYDAMKYDGGQTCWNGPPRSAHVSMLIGLLPFTVFKKLISGFRCQS